MQFLSSSTHLIPSNCKFNLLVKEINPYSAGIDFSRQNLPSVDVRF